ncbi:MAG: hypothetical protein D6753_12070 [Planctomycetota bacterium]|nr:MAG: hypothetical protein D6753_12070 [Planctomycetota bacterium]
MPSVADQPHVRSLALHVARRLELLTETALLDAIRQEDHPRVIEHSLRIARQRGWPAQAPHRWSDVLTRLDMDSARVQLEIALLAADLPESYRVDLLRPVAVAAREPLVQACVMASAGPAGGDLLTALADRIPSQRLERWIDLAIDELYHSAADDQKLQRQLVRSLDPSSSVAAWAWLRSASRLGQAAIANLLDLFPPTAREHLVQQIHRRLTQEQVSPDDWTLIHWLPPDAIQRLASRWLQPESPLEQQQALIDALRQRQETAIGDLLVDRLATMTPALRESALQAIAQRQAWAATLLQRVESGKIPVGLIPPSVRESIRRLGDGQWPARVDTVFGAIDSDRTRVIATYAKEISRFPNPDAERGRQVFREYCAPCHRIDDIGNEVGAGLKDLGGKTPQQLLASILDPDREIDPRFISYTVLTEDDRVLTGVVRDESANQITLVESGGKQHVLPRGSVVRITSSGRSLMPTGLEQQITPAQMADLIAFLRRH